MKRFLIFSFTLSLFLSACKLITVTPTITTTPTLTKTPLAPATDNPLKLGQHAYAFQSSTKTEIRYLMYIPENYTPEKNWPLILFLHGSGQTGTNIERLKEEPLPKTLDTQTDFPFIVISPQLPAGYWSTYIDPLDELLDSIQGTLPVDPNRFYLTGLSLGGFGTWEYALRHPDRFAAIAPIAGGYLFQSHDVPDDICKLKNLPIWAFHGAQDTLVEPYQSEVLIIALQSCGGNAKLTIYPEAGHEASWRNAYADPALYEWLLKNTK